MMATLNGYYLRSRRQRAMYLLKVDKRRKSFLLLWWIFTVLTRNPENLLHKWYLQIFWQRSDWLKRR
jgi:hypothetical protein